MKSTGMKTATQVEVQDKSLRDLHFKIQSTVIYYVAPVSIIIFGLLAYYDNCWQNVVVFVGILLATLAWIMGRSVFKKGHLQTSVAIFLIAAIGFTTLNAALIKGVSPTQLLAGTVAVIYSSFYSKNFLKLCVIGALLGFMIGEVAIYTDYYPMKELSATERLLTEITFAALLLSAAAVFLRGFRNMNEELIKNGTMTNSRLTNVIRTASQIGDTLDGVVSTIETTSKSFASKASEQAVALKEMNVSIDHIRRSAKDTAKAAADTQSMTTTFQNKSAMGSKQLKNMLQGFTQVVEINEEAKVEFTELAQQADSIEEVLRTNREIAAQIKILATNAGIQASKVGKLGRGFRVVANELKAMIQRTDESLKHSRQLLENIRSQANKSRETVEKSSALVKNQFTQLSATGALVDEVAMTFVDAATKVEKIADAAKGQQVRLDEVASGINHLDFTADELSTSTGVLVESIKKLAESNQTIKDALNL